MSCINGFEDESGADFGAGSRCLFDHGTNLLMTVAAANEAPAGAPPTSDFEDPADGER